MAASPPAMPCIPARQTGTACGADMTSCCLLSRLPMDFPGKKDEFSMCWDKLNKHTFKMEPRSPLVSSQASVIQPAAPCLFFTSRGLSLLCDERGKHRAWLSLSSMSAPRCDAGGVATSTTGAAHLLPSAPRRNAAGVPETSVRL